MIVGAIDIGNSAAKGGIFEDGDLVATFSEPVVRGTREVAQAVVRAMIEMGADRVGISSVVPDISNAVESGLRAAGVVDIHHITSDSTLPFSIGYETPSTLGVDRLAAAAGVHAIPELRIGRDTPVVIVDAGTATTIDVLDKGVYVGGPILAGPELLRRALGSGTAQLPQVSLTWPKNAIARSTSAAVGAGIMMGFVDATRGLLLRVIDELNAQPLTLVTGGWAELLVSKISLINHHAPHLVLRGVAHLVELNKISEPR